MELAPAAETSRLSTNRYLERVSKAFRNALQNARVEGLLTDGAPIDELAAFLTVTVTGMLVLIRSGSDPAYLRAGRTQASSG